MRKKQFFMNKIIYLICGLGLLVGVAKAQTITGKVNGEAKPLVGANVKVEGKESGATTNQDGSFELKLNPGTYQLTVSYIGYTSSTQKVSLAAGQVLNLNIDLNPLGNMQEIVIVSSRKPSKISEIPGTVWVVDQQKLQEQIKAGVSFKEALAQLIPGMDAGPEGRTNYGQNLRGRNVLVMIDGVSLNSTRGVSRQFDSIDPFNIERIEVLSGASSIYGGGATGGIVNIITKKGQNSLPTFTTQAGVRSGLQQKNDHDVRVAQSIAGGSENWNGRIGIAYQKNNAAFDANNKQIFTDITQTDLQYNQSFDLFANAEFKLAEKQTLSVNAQYYNSGYVGDRDLYLGANLGGLLANPALLQMRDGFSSTVTPKTSRAGINANYRILDILGGQNLYVQAAARTEKFSFHPFPAQVRNASIPGGGFLYSGSSVQSTDYNAVKIVLAKDWNKFSLTYGVDGDNESFSANQTLFNRTLSAASGGFNNVGIATIGRYPGFTVNGLSGFVQAQLKLADFLSLTGGVRQQRMFVKVGDFVGVDASAAIVYGNGAFGRTATPIAGGKNHYDVNLLNGGLVFKISEPQQAWFNFSQGFNLADPAKYYGQGTYTLSGTNWNLVSATSVANSSLKGIKTNQYEAGYRFRNGIFSAQVAGFYALSDKNLRVVPITLAVEVIDENRRNLGAEGSVAVNFKNGFEVGANGLYIKSQNKQNGSWFLQNVTDASPSKATGFVGYKNKFFGLKAQVFHSFDLKDHAGNELKGYTTLYLLGNVKLPVGNLSVGVQNLLNEDYQTIWSQRSQLLYKGLATPQTFDYLGRGRTYNVTYTINY